MSASPAVLSPVEAVSLQGLIVVPPGGIASRVLAKNAGGTVTLFAFDEGEGLSEHTAPFDALVLVLEGEFSLVVGGQKVGAGPGELVRMPANIPHAVEALEPSRMVLIMLRERSD